MNLLQIHRFDQWSSLFLQKSMILLKVESLLLSSKTHFLHKSTRFLQSHFWWKMDLNPSKMDLCSILQLLIQSHRNHDLDRSTLTLIKLFDHRSKLTVLIFFFKNHQSCSLSSKSKTLSNFDQQCQLWSKSSKPRFYHFNLTFFTQVICRCWNHQQSIYSDFSSLLQLLPTFWRNRVLLRILMIFDEVITFLKTLIRTQNSSLSLKERTLKIWTFNHQRIALSHFERSNLQSFTRLLVQVSLLTLFLKS